MIKWTSELTLAEAVVVHDALEAYRESEMSTIRYHVKVFEESERTEMSATDKERVAKAEKSLDIIKGLLG